jgi:hypothetical protein
MSCDIENDSDQNNMDGIEIIKRIKEIITFILKNKNDKAILYLNYLVEDIQMYKKNSL